MRGFSLFLCLCAFALLRESHSQTFSKHEVHCSRERSKTAWKILDEYLVPFVEQEKYRLPEGCKLHPNNDIFREQELKKEHITAHQWQCMHCKKMFRDEKFLDQHFDNRHSDQLNSSKGCLADACGALHCDYYSAMLQSNQKKRHCNTHAAEKNLHFCQSLARNCFPPQDSPSSRKLHEFFLRQFCDAHDCKKRAVPFARGNGRYSEKALFIALTVFVCCLLVLFYLGVYGYISDLKKVRIKMKRIQKPKDLRKKI